MWKRVTYSAARHACEIWWEYLAIDSEGQTQSNRTDGERLHLCGCGVDLVDVVLKQMSEVVLLNEVD